MPISVHAHFSDVDAFAARAANSAKVTAQDAQLAAQAQLAVAMAQHLSGVSHLCTAAVHALVQEIEAGTLSAAEAVERLANAEPDDDLSAAEQSATAAETNAGGEGKAAAAHQPLAPTRARLQKEQLESNDHPYLRALRPHPTPPWSSAPPPSHSTTFDRTPRFVESMSRQERLVRDGRGPAAYNPQWQANSCYVPVTRSIGLSQAARTSALSMAAPGGATRDAPFGPPTSSMGPQVASTMRSSRLASGMSPSGVFAPPAQLSASGRPLLARPQSERRPGVGTPGPADYN